ncbi:MAG: S9 family peptidase [Spirochaetales bacterium]|nr:S9 family peptidase [Spirochaetales bacterium]
MKDEKKISPDSEEDPYLWLEDIYGDKALAWVRERNAECEKFLGNGEPFNRLEADILRTLDSDEKIPFITRRGPYYYNFWMDAKNPRGLWRRTTLEEYRKDSPAWETVLDIDELGREEGESWVFHGANYLEPAYDLCLVALSRGGSDASVVREFDLINKKFITGGFRLAEARSAYSWIDADTLFVGTDFGPGTLTDSGLPRIVKIWKRGEPLSQAETIYEGKYTDVSCWAYHDPDRDFPRSFIVRSPSFFSNECYYLDKNGAQQKIEAPDDAEKTIHREWLFIRTRTPWTTGGRTYPGGSLLAARFDDYMAGNREVSLLFKPTATTFLWGFTITRNRLILVTLNDVKSRLTLFIPDGGKWRRQAVGDLNASGSVVAWAVDPYESDEIFMTSTDFLTSTSLWYGTAGDKLEQLKKAPSFFDASGMEATQHFAVSKDGTRIPYFHVSSKGMEPDGPHPVLLAGYGGFENSILPYYLGISGRVWLSQGGVYVLANIRGGGEYGPAWHRAALKENRMRAYEDFDAVARDLVSRKVTAAKRIGVVGGSNGGLLVGNMFTLYPEDIGAVVCQMPLLDMKRYSHLLIGAAWMEEYGDPDKPEEWAFIKAFSPYHNVKPGAKYPPILLMTTTKDDRVHPAHARKMMARLMEQGHEALYFENIEGGHGTGADNRQTARFMAFEYAFLKRILFGDG